MSLLFHFGSCVMSRWSDISYSGRVRSFDQILTRYDPDEPEEYKCLNALGESSFSGPNPVGLEGRLARFEQLHLRGVIGRHFPRTVDQKIPIGDHWAEVAVVLDRQPQDDWPLYTDVWNHPGYPFPRPTDLRNMDNSTRFSVLATIPVMLDAPLGLYDTKDKARYADHYYPFEINIPLEFVSSYDRDGPPHISRTHDHALHFFCRSSWDGNTLEDDFETFTITYQARLRYDDVRI